jgi:hypothetical protein
MDGPFIEFVDHDMSAPDSTGYHFPLETKDKASLMSIGFSHHGKPVWMHGY